MLAVFVTACSLWLACFVKPPAGNPICGDFIGFYVPARIVRTAPERLYDLDFQRELRRSISGVDVGLPFAHAPFLAVMLSPLSLLAFPVAYAAWMIVSAAMYAASVILVTPRRFRNWAIPLAFLCPIFPLYTMTAGQVCPIDCLAIALAVHMERQGKHLFSGAALAVCAHKPPLFLFVIAMLVFTRQFRALLGALTGAVALAGISLLAIGAAACEAWLHLVLRWGKLAGTGHFFNLAMYVDLNTFYHLLRLPPGIAVPLGVSLAVVAVVAILYIWRFGPRELAWAAAVIAPLLLNIYAGKYETALLIVALALMSPFVKTDWALIIIPVCTMPVLTQVTATKFGVQVLTLVVLGVLLYQAKLVAEIRSAHRAASSAAGLG